MSQRCRNFMKIQGIIRSEELSTEFGSRRDARPVTRGSHFCREKQRGTPFLTFTERYVARVTRRFVRRYTAGPNAARSLLNGYATTPPWEPPDTSAEGLTGPSRSIPLCLSGTDIELRGHLPLGYIYIWFNIFFSKSHREIFDIN